MYIRVIGKAVDLYQFAKLLETINIYQVNNYTFQGFTMEGIVRLDCRHKQRYLNATIREKLDSTTSVLRRFYYVNLHFKDPNEV